MLAVLAEASGGWPSLEEIGRVMLLRDYNTRLVVASTMMLALVSGAAGAFLLLRKRALLGDALSHATLPGVALAFILTVAFGGEGKSLPILLLGALVFGVLGVGAVTAIRSWTRLKDDAALGIVLSVFFGLGVVLLTIVQSMPQGSAAGLSSFIYGKTASMTQSDFLLITIVACVVLATLALFYKELTLLCFDEPFASAQGWPSRRLDLLLMMLITVVTVIGLQAVGLILVIAFLVIPAAAARFWTERLGWMVIGAAGIGVASGWLGASVSALVPRLPAGAVIVVVGAMIFLISMFFGTARGVVFRLVQRHRLVRTVGRQHLLRAVYEWQETRDAPGAPIAMDELRSVRSWSARALGRLVARARRAGLVQPARAGMIALTTRGRREAARLVRNHRLWEIYLITYADIAPSHVDRDADQIEHVLGPELVAELEQLLGDGEMPMPQSPHALT